MGKACSECGKSLSFFQQLSGEYCIDCRTDMDRKQAESTRNQEKEMLPEERQSMEKRYRAALHGDASPEDLQFLRDAGYLIAGDRLILCPICGHDRFDTERKLMNTRMSTLFGFGWADSEADTRICQNCSYVLWFARK